MEAAQAIALVSDLVRSQGFAYPSEGLKAVRFQAGWRVYAPVDVDESDPMSFLDMPVDRSVFLVGDSGRIEETSTSIPPQQAHQQFMAREAGAGRGHCVSEETEDATGGQHAVEDPDKTVQTMISQTGPDTEDHCRRLLTAAGEHNATRGDVAAIFANHPNADIDAAINQLSQAGLLAR